MLDKLQVPSSALGVNTATFVALVWPLTATRTWNQLSSRLRMSFGPFEAAGGLSEAKAQLGVVNWLPTLPVCQSMLNCYVVSLSARPRI